MTIDDIHIAQNQLISGSAAERRLLTGVIDWSGMACGDPACDLLHGHIARAWRYGRQPNLSRT